MFSKLYKNIRIPLILIAALLVAFIDIFSIVIYADTLDNVYKILGQKRIQRAMDSCSLYLTSVATSAYTLSLDGDVIEALYDHTAPSPVNKLNGLCTYSLKINAVSAYSKNGNIYTSSGISKVPTLEKLKTVEKIRQFIESDAQSALSFRTDVVAGIYDNSTYNAAMGVITYCCKVYREGEVVGWIFTDILPYNLYEQISSESRDAVAFITFGDNYFSYNSNDKNVRLLSGNGRGYFSYGVTSADGLFAIKMFENMAQRNKKVAAFCAIMFAASAAAIALTVALATFAARYVRNRLTKLADKMNSQEAFALPPPNRES